MAQQLKRERSPASKTTQTAAQRALRMAAARTTTQPASLDAAPGGDVKRAERPHRTCCTNWHVDHFTFGVVPEDSEDSEEDKVEVVVRNLSGATRTLKMETRDKVWWIKYRISHSDSLEWRLPIEWQKLLRNGTEVSDQDPIVSGEYDLIIQRPA